MRYTRIAAAAALFAASAPVVQAADLNIVAAVSNNRQIVTFDRTNPGTLLSDVTLQGLPGGERIVGIDYRPADGQLYALTSASRLLRVTNIERGRNELVCTLSVPLSGTRFGVDFNPVPDRLRITSNTGQNLRVNPDTCAVTVDGALNPGTPAVVSSAYTNSAPGTGTTTLYSIDFQTDSLSIQNPPNDGTQALVGPLGVDASALAGMDIRGTDNLALAALIVGGQPGLYRIDLATGAATLIGAFPAGKGISGIAIPTPTTEAYAVGTLNRLLSVSLPKFVPVTAPPSPPTLPFKRVGTITGLAGGESIVGIDFRPANGQLVGLGSTGTFYLIDPATGAASGPLPLTANGTDNTDRNADFTALDGVEFGVDFNPVPDAIRTVSDANQNLRSSPVTGATFTDLSLKGFSATAAAYENSTPGGADPMRTTRLLVIDSARDVLAAQVPPNNGTLVDIGPLGVNAEGIGGFDTAGPTAGGVALAALNLPNATSSTLYTIDAATGAATAVGAIGGSTLLGLAMPSSATTPAADSTVFGLRSDGLTLVSFARNAPGTVTTIGAITSGDLAGADRFIGIDFRPATGALYGVTTANEVFTIDTATGAATLVATLTAATGNDPVTGNPLDPTPDFAGLYGTNYGFDFNPVPDRLRIVSDAALNLRINVTSGGTITDGDINSATAPVPQVVAAAYTNAFPGGAAAAGTVAATTTLYVINTADDSLAIQTPPNSGVVQRVGALGVAVPETGVSFDIVGGANGLAYGIWDADGNGQSEVYRINLTSGAASLVGNLGTVPVPVVGGFAMRLQ